MQVIDWERGVQLGSRDQLKILPKYPPTAGNLEGPYSLCVLLVLGCSSQEEISLELFLDLLSEMIPLRYLIWSRSMSICSSFLFSSFSCFIFCYRSCLMVASSASEFFFYALRAYFDWSSLRLRVLASSRLCGLGLFRFGRLLDELPPQSFMNSKMEQYYTSPFLQLIRQRNSAIWGKGIQLGYKMAGNWGEDD